MYASDQVTVTFGFTSDSLSEKVAQDITTNH